MNKMKEYCEEFKNHRIIYIILGGGVAIGIFLRLFHFGDLMYFELDQARDIFIIHDALRGGHFPLLGPQARPYDLYLGPIFYYFQWIAGLIFGVTPESIALPDIFFSIFAIPLMYIFARVYFDRQVSTILSVSVAVSLFFVVHGRFAWNPNSMVFWSLVTYYALLRAYRGNCFSIRWFFIFILGFSVITQLHFIAFIAVPMTVISYMIAIRMPIPARVVFGSICLVSLLYLPVIISDIHSQGKNARTFFSAIIEKEYGNNDVSLKENSHHNIYEKIFRATQETSSIFWIMLSADHSKQYNIQTQINERGDVNIVCNQACYNTLSRHVWQISIFFMVCGVLIWRLYVTRKNTKIIDIKKIDEYRQLLLLALWLFFGILFLVLIAYQITARYYLYLAVPFLMMFGIVMQKIMQIKICGAVVGWSVAVVFFCINTYSTWQYFGVLQSASNAQEKIMWHDAIIPRGDFVTLGQLRDVGEYLESIHEGNNFVIVGDNQYVGTLYYITTIENRNIEAQCYILRSVFKPDQISGMTYYLLQRDSSSIQISDEMRRMHDIVDQKKFGTISLYKFFPKIQDKQNRGTLPMNCLMR